jgi:hypothetical protein
MSGYGTYFKAATARQHYCRSHIGQTPKLAGPAWTVSSDCQQLQPSAAAHLPSLKCRAMMSLPSPCMWKKPDTSCTGCRKRDVQLAGHTLTLVG